MTVGDARFVELYELHYRHIYAYCKRRTSVDKVEDAVADTFLTAWRKIDELPDGEGALPWLYAVAYRVLGHQWRGASRQSKLKEKLASIGVSHDPPPEEYIAVRQESEQVLKALSSLKDREQEILRLSVWEELHHQEIAQMLDLNTDAVKKRLSRARRNLLREYNRMEEKDMKSPAAQEGGAW